MRKTVTDPANLLCGGIFIAFGIFFVSESLQMEVGDAYRMGPGYLPLILAAILIILGTIISIQRFRVSGEAVHAVAWPWRAADSSRADLFRANGP